jgi:N-dimethylarginine dimethylaminohydrolase
MKETSHSEYLKLKSVFLKSIANGFISQSKLAKEWESLNYLAQPDFTKALEEYKFFETILKENEIDILHFGSTKLNKIDAVYCRDASIATDFGMIICNMGKEGRISEPNLHLHEYEKHCLNILGVIESPGTLEGGDVSWLDENTLAVGHTYRTNEEGINQIKGLLEPRGIDVIVAALPHYKGQQDVFHLMSILSPVDKDLAVVYSPLMPIKFRNELLSRGFQLIEVPEEEFESMGCNVLAIAPRQCIMVDGNPITKNRLESKGCEVLVYKGTEISVKGGGGPTCLTRPIKRIN